MGLINYSDVTGPILNAQTNDKVNLHTGYVLREIVGYAKLTPTLQTNIPILIPSNAQAAGELVTNPDRRLVLPIGAIVCRIALKLPRQDPNKTTQFGNLPIKSTLIGTTGELVKVGADNVFTTTDPSIAAVANAYAPNAEKTVQRPLGIADAIPTGLITVSAATNMSLLVSNAGSTAAGTGISTSAGVALAIVQICYYEIQPAITYEQMGYESYQKGI
jgi:hypothetical protein